MMLPAVAAVTTYALLVGIDDYQPPVPRLDGCRNDIDALGAYLSARSGTEPVCACWWTPRRPARP